MNTSRYESRVNRVSTIATPMLRTLLNWILVASAATVALAVVFAFLSGMTTARFLHTYLLAASYVLTTALGCLFFVLIHHIAGSGWSVVLRRIAEQVAAALPIVALIFAPIFVLLLAGNSQLYSWNDPGLQETDPLIRGKTAYLNAPFFGVRAIGYFAIWCFTALFFLQRSTAQDKTGNTELTLQMRRWSGPALIAFALTVCFAAFDWLMSLDPHWFSTIYGVYVFAGSVVAGLAAIIVIANLLESVGLLRGIIQVDHYHDLGKLLFGFVMFWAYMAFSQYLLIWYANIPEETGWYAVRQENGWQWVSLILLFGHFLIPFGGLMPRSIKRNRATLTFWAVWLLLMHWVDLYLLVMPSHDKTVQVAVADFLLPVGMAGGVFVWIGYRLVKHAVIPIRDPQLEESLAFRNH